LHILLTFLILHLAYIYISEVTGISSPHPYRGFASGPVWETSVPKPLARSPYTKFLIQHLRVRAPSIVKSCLPLRPYRFFRAADSAAGFVSFRAHYNIVFLTY